MDDKSLMTDAEFLAQLDLTHNIDPICPHCGNAIDGAWEYDLGDGETGKVECDHCEESFWIQCFVAITYTTSKKEPE